MERAEVAVLLISADFLGSKFIKSEEVPFLLERREKDGLRVLPVIVRPCPWEKVEWVEEINVRPKDGAPLSGFSDHNAEQHLTDLATEMLSLLDAKAITRQAQGRRPPSRVEWCLTNPYGMPPNFTGRQAERGTLSAWLENGPSLFILRALGGFGKSALVWHWLMNDVEPARWPRVVWWSFYEANASFDSFLAVVLTYFGLDPKALGPRERVLAVLEFLQRRRALIVLDGFERELRAFSGMGAAYQGDEESYGSPESGRSCINPLAEVFLRGVSSLPDIQGRALLTTRLRPRIVETRFGELLTGCREVELKGLNPADAIAFFQAEKIQGARSEIQAVCTAYGLHPLSLRLVAGLVARDLKSPRDIIVAQQLDISGDLKERQHHVLEQSYGHLPIGERRLLSRIACFRGAVSYEAISAAKGDFTDEGLDTALQDLMGRGLVYREEEDGRFDLHPIVRRYAYDRLGAEERAAAHRSLRDYFAAVPEREQVHTLDELAPVVELYHHMVRAEEYDAAFEIFRDRIWTNAYYIFGAYGLCIELLQGLFPDGEARPPRLEPHGHTWVLNGLAISYSLNGQPRRSLPLLAHAREINKARGTKEKLSNCLINLAGDQASVGSLKAAEESLLESLRHRQQAGDTFRVADAYCELGLLLAYLGRWNVAKEALERTLQIYETFPKERIPHAVWQSISILYLLEKRALAAELSAAGQHLSRQGLKGTHRILELANEGSRGSSYTAARRLVRTRWLAGTVARESSDLISAEKHLTEALIRCRRINLVELEADILIDLARLRILIKEPAEARRLADEALTITERSGYALQGADAHLILAQLSRRDDRHGAVLEHAREARRLARCDGPPDYTYKVAWDEAGALLAELGKAVEEA